MSTLGKVGGTVAAVVVWLVLSVMSGIDTPDAHGAEFVPPRCVSAAERHGIEQGVDRRGDVEASADVRGRELPRLRDDLVHGVAYRGCAAGSSVVVLYRRGDDVALSVIVVRRGA